MRSICLLLAWIPAVALTVAGADSLTQDEIKAGRKVYVAKCAKCHQFYEPKRYSAADWQRWMQSMSKKSKLKPEQEELLTRYLEAYRSGELKKDR